MTENAEVKLDPKGKPLFKKLLLIIPILFLIVITAATVLYIYTRMAKTTRDDVASIISTQAMTSAERFTFDAASLKMEMSLDKSDLWWLLKEIDKDDMIGRISGDMEDTGFNLKSYGLDINDNGVLISAEITYGNFLRLPLKLLASTSVNNDTLTISPSGVYLGKIKLPIKLLPLDSLASVFGMDSVFSLDDLKFEIPLSDLKLVSTLSDIYYKDKRIIMVHKLDDSLFSHSISAFGDNLDWYAEECTDCIEVLREYSDKGTTGERFYRLAEDFSNNPGSFSGFIAETLAVCSESAALEYVEENKLWLARTMPEITEKRVSDLHTTLYNLCSLLNW